MTGSVNVETPLSVVKAGTFEAGQTIQEVFDAQSFGQVPVICLLNDKPRLRASWDYVVTDSDVLKFVVMPQGSNTAVFSAIALVALLIAAPYAAGALSAAGAAGIGFGADLSIAGVSASGVLTSGLLVSGVFLINVLLPSTSAATSAGASPTYSLTPQGNTARLLQPVPVAYGRSIIVPDFASTPWSEFIGNDQYLYQLFSCGAGSYDQESIRFDTTEVWNSTVGLTGNYTGITLQKYEPGEVIDLFDTNVCTSTDVSSQDCNTQGVDVGPYVVNPAGTVITEIAFDFVFPRGLYWTNPNGILLITGVTTQLQVQQIDDTGTPIGSWFTLGTPTTSAQSATPQRATYKFQIAQGRYQAKVTRTSPYDTDSSVAVDCSWVGLKGTIPSSNIFAEHTTLAMKCLATGQLSGASSRSVNVIQTRKISVWDGSSWSPPVASRSIAWAAADAMKNTEYGAGLTDAQIDLDKLLALDATWTARGDNFDGVFDTSQAFWTTLGQIVAAGRAQPLMVAGIVSFYRDEPRSLARGVFTPRNMARGSFNTKHVLFNDQTPDYAIVQFMDSRTWTMNQITCRLSDSVDTEVTAANISMFGVTDYKQAWREGMYQVATNAYRRIFAGFDTELEGGLLFRGDPIIIGHDAPQWGQSGDVTGWDSNLTLTLSEQLSWSGVGTFYIILTQKNNKQFGPISVTQGTAPNIAIMDAADLATAEATSGVAIVDVISLDGVSEETRFLFGTSDITTRNAIVAGIDGPSATTFTVSAVIDDPRVYTADTGIPPLPGYGPGIVSAATFPLVGSVSASLTSGTDPVTIAVTWVPHDVVDSYIMQISSDGGNTWTTEYAGTATTDSITVRAASILFRVAGIAGGQQGPFVTTSGVFGTSTGLPDPPSLLTASAGFGGTPINASWTAGMDFVTGYTVTVVVSGVTKITKTGITDTTIIIVESDITAAGGPWTTFDVHVKSTNGVGSSADIVTTVSGVDTAVNSVILNGQVAGSGPVGTPIAVTIDTTIAPVWTGLHTFDSGIAITPAGSTEQGFNISQAGPTSGTTAGVVSNASLGNAWFSYNFVDITDSIDVTGSGHLTTNGMLIGMTTGGSNATGSKSTLAVTLLKPTASDPAILRDHVAFAAYAVAQASDGGTGTTPGASKGTLFAGEFSSVLAAGAIDYLEVAGSEVDIGIDTGASASYRFGWSVVSIGSVQAAVADAAYEVGGNTSSWQNALYLAGLHGAPPITGSVITTDGSAMTIGSVIDVGVGVTITNYLIRAPGFVIDGSGNINTGVWQATTIAVAHGGTGQTSLTAHSILLGNGTSAINSLAIGTAGRVVIDQGTGADPAFKVISGDATLSGAGALTVTKTNGTPFGTAAAVNIGTSGASVPLLNAANTFSMAQIISGGVLGFQGGGASTSSSGPQMGGRYAGSVTANGSLGLSVANGALIIYRDENVGGAALVFVEAGNAPIVIAQTGSLFTTTDPGPGGNKWVLQNTAGHYGDVLNRFTASKFISYWVIMTASGGTFA